MRVAVQKLPGVESVNVSLERASTDIQLRPGNSITLGQLRNIIKNNGFTSKEATVTAVGNVIEQGGQPALDVTGTNIVMLMVTDPTHPTAFKQVQDRLHDEVCRCCPSDGRGGIATLTCRTGLLCDLCPRKSRNAITPQVPRACVSH